MRVEDADAAADDGGSKNASATHTGIHSGQTPCAANAMCTFPGDGHGVSKEPRNATECTELLSKLAHHLRTHSGKNITRNGVSATFGDNLQFRKILFLAEMGLYDRATQLAVTLAHVFLDRTNGSQANPHHLASALEKLALTIASTSMPLACSITHNFPPALPTSGTCGSIRAVRAQVACRIDLAGGWTDTPPITYQCQDPAVLNVAVLVDGKKPISCECTKLDAYAGVYMDVCGKLLHFETAKGVWNNRCHPNKEGSLLCAILVASGLVTKDRMDGIEDPKFRFYEGDDALDLPCRGLFIKCHSVLPHGSGMGTSSILSAALLASLWRLFGKEYTNEYLISTVLKVEQLHTTGGGWQDQVGGIVPAVKIVSLDSATNDVRWRPIDLAQPFKREISQRLVLIYTGTTRLAKNLLEQVILSWLRREPTIKHVVQQLADDARAASEVMLKGVFPAKYCERYRSLKRTFSEDTEPPHVKELVDALKTNGIIECACPAGAGGGGYIFVWLAEGMEIGDVRRFLRENTAFASMHASSVDVDDEPLHITAY